MCLEPENDALGLSWCRGLQMSFPSQRLPLVWLLFSDLPLCLSLLKIQLKTSPSFKLLAWRALGEHFSVQRKNSALFCKAQGILFLNTAL